MWKMFIIDDSRDGFGFVLNLRDLKVSDLVNLIVS